MMDEIKTPGAGNYEFSDADNQLIAELARKMSLVGLFLLCIGVLYLALFVLMLIQMIRPGPTSHELMGLLGTGLGALILLSLGVWTRKAAAAFGQIVATKDSDVPHLMNALVNLRNVYSLIYTLILLYLVLVLVVLVIGVVAWFNRVG